MRHIYADFIDQVAVPARYLGGEYLSVTKQPADVDVRVALAFPDVYEIGMSHLGTKILYSLLNKHDRIWAERVFTPWIDMEAELRARALPLVSLESSTPLSDFDVIGFSLQYELTFTNVLTMLDLGGVPLRSADRAEDDPLVICGGPNASHPEPIAPFFDAVFVGEAEEELPAMLLDWARLRRPGADGQRRSRPDALAELAARYPVYVPALYATERCPDTGMLVVGAPLDPRAPARVRRGVVADIDAYPFPSDTPVPYAEAVFDRAAVEIARGCTEGCRFCQAGMIYRPVRERSPGSVIDSVMQGVTRAGYDETALTSLSTADYSCITPLVKTVMGELRRRKVSVSVSSLRAYGLNEDILDEMASMRITGLTFAPEAGTQRMRDVVNKNVTEAHIEESSHRVFARGWNKLKLYFMIGLPTEEDDDVVGIVETGKRMLRAGRRHVGKRAEVTVSVSSHVPKPHTPFQWCAQDSIDEIGRKQRLLRDHADERGLRLKYHDCGISFVEGMLSRADRRMADAIELAWRRGARFDGWDELFDLDRWTAVFDECGLDAAQHLGTRPVTARLPWDHIDVGLEDGFLLREYRKAVKSRLSPPCGKVAGQLIHHTNLTDAAADTRKLVCYDCGVACDLSRMRTDRLVALESLGAASPPAPAVEAAVAEDRPDAAATVEDRPGVAAGAPGAPPQGRKRVRVPRTPQPQFPAVPSRTYRVRYAKLGRAAFLGHLDTARVIARLMRRADIAVAYSRGFHPKPQVKFSPALSLGVPSLGELMDVAVETLGEPIGAEALRERMSQVAPEGLAILSCELLDERHASLASLIDAYDLVILPAPDGIAHDAARLARLAGAFLARDAAVVVRPDKKASRRSGKPGRAGPRAHEVDIRPLVRELSVVGEADAAALCRALDWPAAPALLGARVEVRPDGSARPVEVATALGVWGDPDPRARHALVARLGFPGVGDPGGQAVSLASGPRVATLPLASDATL